MEGRRAGGGRNGEGEGGERGWEREEDEGKESGRNGKRRRGGERDGEREEDGGKERERKHSISSIEQRLSAHAVLDTDLRL